MIPIKSGREIEKMARAGHILARIMDELAGVIRPGVATLELDRKAASLMAEARVRSAFKGYRGYPAHICVSLNEEVVHGIPGVRKLAEGDIAAIDIGIEDSGYFVDMAKTFPVGCISDEKEGLIAVTKAALEEAIKMMRPGNRLFDISSAVQRYAESRGFSVVRDFVGHGIGLGLHEEPQIPNYGSAGEGPLLEEGMVFAVEPMINCGGWEVEIAQDGWTAVTKDRRPSAHFEHTVAILRNGSLILTAQNA